MQSRSTINQLLCKKGKKTSILDFFKIDGNIITGKKSIDKVRNLQKLFFYLKKTSHLID